MSSADLPAPRADRWGCCLCGAPVTGDDELPGGQPVCSSCSSTWTSTRVYVVAGARGCIAHTHGWCVQIENAIASKNRVRSPRDRVDADDVLRPKRLGQVPNYTICVTCWSKAGRADDG